MNLEPHVILRYPGVSVFVYAISANENHKIWATKIVSQVLKQPNINIQIETDSLGKPILPHGMGFINWSNSKGYSVFAYSKESEVGIDLEFHKERNFLRVSKRFFAQSEITNNADFFYTSWTKKEAYYKCLGGNFFSILKNDSYPNAKIWNLQGPYREKHELALAIKI